MKLKLRFRSVEYFTITREVSTAEFKRRRGPNEDQDITPWLDDKFRGDGMVDSDIETVEFELKEWQEV